MVPECNSKHHASDSAGAPPLKQMDSGAPKLFTMSNSDAPGAHAQKRQDALGELVVIIPIWIIMQPLGPWQVSRPRFPRQ
jgi:hypothetical protein